MSQDLTMPTNLMKQWLPLAVLALALQGGLAQAQTPPMAWAAGYSTYQLRPASGNDQRMNGFGLAGQYRLDPAWSAELAFTHHTGTEDQATLLRQVGIMVGPRYTRALSARWQGTAHFLIGREQLQASSGPASAQSTSFAFEPGVGLEYAVNRHLALRGQEDLVFTHYAGVAQHSPCLFLGVVLR
jgi:hypothetical protein